MHSLLGRASQELAAPSFPVQPAAVLQSHAGWPLSFNRSLAACSCSAATWWPPTLYPAGVKAQAGGAVSKRVAGAGVQQQCRPGLNSLRHAVQRS